MVLEKLKLNFVCPLEKFFYNFGEKSLYFVEECKPCLFYDKDVKEVKHPNDVCNLNLSSKQVRILKEIYFANKWVDDSEQGFLEYLSSYNQEKKYNQKEKPKNLSDALNLIFNCNL